MDNSELTNEVLELTLACQQGDATAEEHARLERLLADNPQAILLYLRIVDDTLTLLDAATARENAAANPAKSIAFVESPSPEKEKTSFLSFATRRQRWAAIGVLACTLLLCVAGLQLWTSSAQPTPTLNAIAEGDSARIVEMSNVEWVDGAQKFKEWSTLRPGANLKFKSGWVNLFLSDGAELVIEGPADVQFVSSSKVIARRGKLAARVGPGAIGFRVETPHANVIDRGTEFGLYVDGDSHTSVVVYKGIVDLDVVGDRTQPRRRLETGEGLSVDSEGQLSRIGSVPSADFLEPPQLRVADKQSHGLIASVSDNVRSLRTTKYSRIVPGGFREDCRAYVDRLHEWNGVDARGLPPFLIGGDYVMTFNDDKVINEIELALNINQPANLYVLIDDRVPPPEWLKRDFVDTNWDVGSDEGWEDKIIDVAVGPGQSIEHVFSVWRRRVSESTTVLLGAVAHETQKTGVDVGRSMYGVVVTPLRRERTDRSK